jgi:hypothetical protein
MVVLYTVANLASMGLNLPHAFRGLRNVRFVTYTLVRSFLLVPGLA